MVVWSSMNRIISAVPQKNNVALTLRRHMSGHNKMEIEPSRWQYSKFKDLVHYYTMVGLIPVFLVAGYVNIFIGPAKLSEIPEGYTPKHWEYYKHPITRWIARYCQNSYQQEYEKYMHYMYQEDAKAKLRILTREIKAKMAERHDYQAWYYTPVTAKYYRETRAITQETIPAMGENLSE